MPIKKEGAKYDDAASSRGVDVRVYSDGALRATRTTRNAKDLEDLVEAFEVPAATLAGKDGPSTLGLEAEEMVRWIVAWSRGGIRRAKKARPPKGPRPIKEER